MTDTGRVTTRRTLLLGAVGVTAVGVVGTGAGVYEGVLPGRPQLQDALGLNGEAGTVPDVEPAHVEEGSFVSERRGGLETGFTIVTPLGAAAPLPVVVALHGRGSDHRSLVGPKFRIERFLEDHVERGGEPFAVGTVDGGQSYWHERPDGEDAGAMVVDEFLPMLAERGLLAGPGDRIGLLGWSMGGYGALRLAAPPRGRPGGGRRGGEPGHVVRPGRRVEVGLPRTPRSTRSSRSRAARTTWPGSRSGSTAAPATSSTGPSRTTSTASRPTPT